MQGTESGPQVLSMFYTGGSKYLQVGTPCQRDSQNAFVFVCDFAEASNSIAGFGCSICLVVLDIIIFIFLVC